MGKQILNGVLYGGFPSLGAREDYTCDLLYENTDFSVASGTANVEHTYTLNASIDNYDAIQVLAYGYNHTNGSREQIGSQLVMKPEYYRTNPTNANSNAVFYVVNASVVSSTNRRFGFRFSSNTVINTWASRMDSEEPKLYKVYGLKFGSYHKYSTTEQVIGTWVDGKPLYERSYSVSTPSALNTVNQIIPIPAEMNIVNLFGMYDNQFPINFFYAANNRISTWVNNAKTYVLNMALDNGMLNKNGVVTIQYTKTTD